MKLINLIIDEKRIELPVGTYKRKVPTSTRRGRTRVPLLKINVTC